MPSKTKFPLRILLVVCCFLMTILLYIDRAVISVAKQDITEELGFSLTQFGWIMAVFTLGYALAQAPSGMWVDRKGAKIVISSIVAVWSILTAMTGLAWNFISMLLIRFFFGVGEAGAFPALSKVTLNWFPTKERGIVQGINFSGSRLGAAFGIPVVAVLVDSLGWRMSFVLFGAIGCVFSVLWYIFFRNKPEEAVSISDQEKQYIIENRQQIAPTQDTPLPLSSILKSRSVQLTMLQYICSNFTFYFTLTWMFPYIQQRFSLTNVEAGLYSSIPLIAGFFGNLVSGLCVDALYKRGKSTLSRRLPAMIGFALATIGMLVVATSTTQYVAIAFLALAVFGADMTLSPSWAFCIDVGKQNSGAVSGTMNMAGNLGAFTMIIAYPYLLEWTGSPLPFFYLASGLSLFAIFVWLFMDPNKTIVPPNSAEKA